MHDYYSEKRIADNSALRAALFLVFLKESQTHLVVADAQDVAPVVGVLLQQLSFVVLLRHISVAKDLRFGAICVPQGRLQTDEYNHHTNRCAHMTQTA